MSGNKTHTNRFCCCTGKYKAIGLNAQTSQARSVLFVLFSDLGLYIFLHNTKPVSMRIGTNNQEFRLLLFNILIQRRWCLVGAKRKFYDNQVLVILETGVHSQGPVGTKKKLLLQNPFLLPSPSQLFVSCHPSSQHMVSY